MPFFGRNRAVVLTAAAAITAVALGDCARRIAIDDAGSSTAWPRIDPARVQRFTVTTREHGEVALERRGGAWWMTRPFPGPAAHSYVVAALAQLGDARPEGELARAAPSNHGLGLDAAHVLEVRLEPAANDADALLRVGSPLPGGGNAVQVGAKIYRVREALRTVLEAPPRDWRERSIVSVADPVAIEWRSGHGVFRFERGAQGWAASSSPSASPLVCFAPWRLEPLVRELATLRAVDFARPDVASGIVADAPGATLVGASGVSVTLRFGRSPAPDRRYVQREGDPSVYIVTLSRGRLDFDPASVQDCGVDR